MKIRNVFSDRSTAHTPRQAEFEVSIDDSAEHGPVRVTVRGEVDLLSESLFRLVLHAAASRGRAILVDLTDVPFFGVCGLRCLHELDAAPTGPLLSVIAPASSSAARLLRSVGAGDRWLAASDVTNSTV